MEIIPGIRCLKTQVTVQYIWIDMKSRFFCCTRSQLNLRLPIVALFLKQHTAAAVLVVCPHTESFFVLLLATACFLNF